MAARKKRNNKASTKQDKIISGLKVLKSLSTGKKKSEVAEYIKDYEASKKYKGKKKDIYRMLSKLYDAEPNLRPEFPLRKTTEQLYKQLKSKKVSKDSIYKILIGKGFRSLKELDTLLSINQPDIIWYLFSSTTLFIDGGISLSEYNESKEYAKIIGIDTFKYADKSNKKKVHSKIIKLLKGDIINITSNNKALERKINIYGNGLQTYHTDLKKYIVGKAYSHFLYVNIEQGKNGVIINYRLDDTDLEEGKPKQPTEPTTKPTPPTPPIPQPVETETDKAIKLELAKKETLAQEEKTALAKAKEHESRMQLIKIYQGMGMSAEAILKALGLT
jgi:hypothetical protein